MHRPRSFGSASGAGTFNGWRIVSVAFLCLFVSVGFSFYSYGALFKALVDEFGGSRLGVSLGSSILFAELNAHGAKISPFSVSGDFTLSTQFDPLGNDADAVGLIFGYQDPDNFFFVSWGGSDGQVGIEAFRKVAGVNIPLDDNPTFWLGGSSQVFEITITVIPEPSAPFLLGPGLVGLAALQRRRKSSFSPSTALL